MKTFTQGRQAEAVVASHLKARGYEILAQNWRRPRCEIDIVAKKINIVYFVEVKFRRQDAQGDGFEHITPAKIRQMHLAAQLWLAENDFDGDWRLVAAAVSEATPPAISIVEV